jgi:predicted DNA-binding transcriptional regulator YafY
VQITYAAQAPDGEADSHHGVSHDEVNPLALIVSGRVIHLVCTFAESAEIRQLALHRIKSATILAVKAEYPAQADLERYFAQGSAQTQRRPMIDLKVRFERIAAAHLYDTPLSADQRIEDAGAGQVIVTATVADTAELRFWLLGFGPLAEVLKPEALRQHMERSQRMAAQRYLHRS